MIKLESIVTFLLCLNVVYGRMCSMPGVGVPTCSTDEDCCGRQACVAGFCQMTGVSFGAIDGAFISNMMVENAAFDMNGIVDQINAAAKAVAGASQAVSEAGKKKSDDLQSKLIAAGQSAKDKASELGKNAKDKVDALTKSAKDKAAEVGTKVSGGLKAAKEKLGEITSPSSNSTSGTPVEALEQAATMISNAVTEKFYNSAASSVPKFDYGKFATPKTPGTSWKGVPGVKMSYDADIMPTLNHAASFPGMPKKKFPNAAAKADSTPAAGGAMDWKKFIPGKTNSASAPAAGATPGGMDWKKFIPGKTNSASSPAAGATPGGMDWKKMVPGANKAAGGGFDWSKSVPKGGSPGGATPGAASGTKYMKSIPTPKNAATKTEEQAPSTKTEETPDAGAPAEPAAPGSNVGETGGPCGAMVYKDFGPCKKKTDKCVKSPWPFAPGTCEDKKGVTKTNDVEMTIVNAAAMPVAGSAGGPCGFWKLGKMDFGECADGLTCEEPKMKVTYGKDTYSLPNRCNNSTNSSAADTDEPDSTNSVEDVETKDEDPDKVAELAKQVADKADEVANKAAAAAELVAHKLLAAAAELKKSAAKLKEDAATVKSSTTKKDVTMYSDVPSSSGGYSITSWLMFAAVCGSAAFAWTKFNQNSYTRI